MIKVYNDQAETIRIMYTKNKKFLFEMLMNFQKINVTFSTCYNI